MSRYFGFSHYNKVREPLNLSSQRSGFSERWQAKVTLAHTGANMDLVSFFFQPLVRIHHLERLGGVARYD
jgi:hypothetical protein